MAKTKRMAVAAVVAVGLGLAGASFAGAPLDLFGNTPKDPNITVRLVPSYLAVTPGQKLNAAVDIRIAEGWKYYSPDPGGAQKLNEARILAQVAGVAVDPSRVLWPPDHPYKDVDGSLTNVYSRRAVAYVPVEVPGGTPAGNLKIRVKLDGQVCSKDTCDRLPAPDGPDAVAAETTVQVASSAKPNPAWAADPRIAGGLAEAGTAAQLKAAHAAARAARVESQARQLPQPSDEGAMHLTVWGGLGVALLAGLVLNIMPCVLPVIPIRILSLVKMAGEDRRRIVTLGLAFAGGIVLFFVALGLVNVALRLALQEAFNLGQQFALVPVRIAMGMIVVALSANLLGAFNVVVPSRIAGLGQTDGPFGNAQDRGSHLGSVAMGVMMAVLATPCSFAFLAAALAWAQVQPLWLGTLAIVLIGVGMAVPHALLVAWPDLLRKIPKPGRWMELFKQSMGFLMLPVALWLFSTLRKPGTGTYPFWVAGYGVVLAFCLWVWGTWVRYDAPLKRKLIVRGAAAAVAVAAGFWMLTPPEPLAVELEQYGPARLQALQEGGKPFLVDFTASWCLKCVQVDAEVFDQPDIAAELRKRRVVALRADVTERGSPGDELLRSRFNSQPPLTVVYSANGQPSQLLRGSYSKADLLAALDKAGANKAAR